MKELVKAHEEVKVYIDSIKRKNRFFVDPIFTGYFDRFIESNTINIPENTLFFRSRINIAEQNGIPYSDIEMNMPPPSIFATSGRANPLGINYFYLSSNKETSISEIRPSIEDKITVATFMSTQELKVVEIGNMVGISGNVDDHGNDDTKKIMYFMLKLMSEFTKPLKGIPEIEYAPFQFFAEYCKMKELDGIRFFSSVMSKTGENNNYVIFSNSKLQIVNKSVTKVSGIIYETVDVQNVP